MIDRIYSIAIAIAVLISIFGASTRVEYCVIGLLALLISYQLGGGDEANKNRQTHLILTHIERITPEEQKSEITQHLKLLKKNIDESSSNAVTELLPLIVGLIGLGSVIYSILNL